VNAKTCAGSEHPWGRTTATTVRDCCKYSAYCRVGNRRSVREVSGAIQATQTGRAVLAEMYKVSADVVGQLWSQHEGSLTGLAGLAGRLVQAALPDRRRRVHCGRSAPRDCRRHRWAPFALAVVGVALPPGRRTRRGLASRRIHQQGHQRDARRRHPHCHRSGHEPTSRRALRHPQPRRAPHSPRRPRRVCRLSRSLPGHPDGVPGSPQAASRCSVEHHDFGAGGEFAHEELLRRLRHVYTSVGEVAAEDDRVVSGVDANIRTAQAHGDHRRVVWDCAQSQHVNTGVNAARQRGTSDDIRTPQGVGGAGNAEADRPGVHQAPVAVPADGGQGEDPDQAPKPTRQRVYKAS